MKIKKYLGKKGILIIIILLALVGVTLMLTNNRLIKINGELTQETSKQEEITVTTQIKGLLENDGFVMVLVKIESNIEMTGVTFPNEDGTNFTMNMKRYEVAKDFKMKLGKEYVINIDTIDGQRIDKTIAVNLEAVASIKEIKSKKFKIDVATNYPEAEIAEYRYYVNGEVVNSGKKNTSYTVVNLQPETRYVVYVEVVGTIGEIVKTQEQTVITEKLILPTIISVTNSNEARKGNELSFDWEQMALIAEAISNNSKDRVEKNVIDENTSEILINMDNNNYTIGVGDYSWVNGKQVRIMGFNHDDLASIIDKEGNEVNQYGIGKTNIKAGISFEYMDPLGCDIMNKQGENYKGGWKASRLREKLQGTANDKTVGIINTLENKDQIKKVVKTYYIVINNNASVATCDDYLWLLACSEIWNNGNSDGAYGPCSQKEGEQYKYYSIVNANYNSSCDLVAKNIKDGRGYWLRSGHDRERYICVVGNTGDGGISNCAYLHHIAPGFCI